MTDTDATGARTGLSRRALLLGATAGLATAALAAPAQAAPVYTPIPKLPYEVSRADTRISRIGRKPYEVVDVEYLGDRARLYVPHATPPKTPQLAVVWFYHSNNSDYTAMDGAYAYPGMLAVDRGAVAICPNYGGSLWTSQPSLDAHVNWSRYVTNVFKPAISFGRANSGGGPLMTYAYGTRIVPTMRGIYLANAAYDMEDLYLRDPVRVPPVYGNDPAACAATNPARLPQSVWARTKIKTVVSLSDALVPAQTHGLALAATAQPVALDVRVQYHDEGHIVPSWVNLDMADTFLSWL